MSSKLIVGVVAVGAVLAATPFYLSGYFAHQTIYDQLTLLSAPYKDSIQITNPVSNLGLLKSYYGYDVTISLNDPQFAVLKQRLGKDKLEFHVNNKLKHGFLQVDINSTLSGELQTLFDKALEKSGLKAQDTEKPLMTLDTDASFSLGGAYQLTSTFAVQGFSVDTVNDLGDTLTITTTPAKLDATMTAKTFSVDAGYDNIAIKTPDSTVNINQLALVSSGELHATDGNQITNFGNQNFKLSLDSISMAGEGQEIEVLKALNWGLSLELGTDRAELQNTMSLANINNPQMPAAKVEDIAFDFTLDLGINAAKAYYKAAKAAQGTAPDQAAAMAMFANLLSENINLNITGVKAKTVSGPVDLTGSVNVAAVDVDQFSANPAVLMQSLKYAMQGEMPKDLLMMTGQLPPEFIDNLVQQQMIEVKDNQIVFKLTGESGHINLNDKPLM